MPSLSIGVYTQSYPSESFESGQGFEQSNVARLSFQALLKKLKQGSKKFRIRRPIEHIFTCQRPKEKALGSWLLDQNNYQRGGVNHREFDTLDKTLATHDFLLERNLGNTILNTNDKYGKAVAKTSGGGFFLYLRMVPVIFLSMLTTSKAG